MALFKCKMCGGALEVSDGATIIECGYCGTEQTLPNLNDERRANMYDRANHFRRNNEFDKAMGIYENILNEDNTDAEAYWSIVLCRYGIEYVEDPSSRKRIPTINRAQFTSIFDDEDYKSALQYADMYQRNIYEDEAKEINEIQKGILAISEKEEPFDVFICYKETDNNGRRTPDSVLAQELYYQLKQEGFKVFFSRITLEDKLGSAYEPYIFAALNSAKAMVVLGTKPEYFNAVWVKNEWSRFLGLIKKGKKKTLIPAYRDMDPYDLPEEFSHLQAQDMSKLGFMQDLIRGIKKIVKTSEPKGTVVKETVVNTSNTNIAPLLKRAFIFVEDGDFDRADEFCEQVLNQDPENANAYLCKLLIEFEVNNREQLKYCSAPINTSGNYQKILRFGDEQLKNEIREYSDYINECIKNVALKEEYDSVVSDMCVARTEAEYRELAERFSHIGNYKDALKRRQQCFDKAESIRIEEENYQNDSIYEEARALKGKKTIDTYRAIVIFGQAEKFVLQLEKALSLFESIPDWKDSKELANECLDLLKQLEPEHQKRCEAEEGRLKQKEIEEEKRFKRDLKITIIILGILVLITICVGIYNLYILPHKEYNKALGMMSLEQYSEAYTIFDGLNTFKDSEEMAELCQQKLREKAQGFINAENYSEFLTFSWKNDIYDVIIPRPEYENFYNAVILYYGSDTASYYSVYAVERELKDLIPYMKLISSGCEQARDVIAFYEIVKQREVGNEHQLFKDNMKAISNTFDTPLCRKILLSNDIIGYFLIGKWSDVDGNSLNFSEKDGSTLLFCEIPSPDVEHKYYDIQNLRIVWLDENSQVVANVCDITFINANTMTVYAYEDEQTYTLTRK